MFARPPTWVSSGLCCQTPCAKQRRRVTSVLTQLQNHIAFPPLSLRALLFSIADVKKHTNPFNSTSKPSLPSQKKKQTKQK